MDSMNYFGIERSSFNDELVDNIIHWYNVLIVVNIHRYDVCIHTVSTSIAM